MRPRRGNRNPARWIYAVKARPLHLPFSVLMKLRISTLIWLLVFSSSASAAGLTDYVGAYPFEEIGGYAFFENPAVRDAIDRVAGEGVSDWLAGLNVGLPIEQEADGLIAIACEEHNCAANNAAVAVSVKGSLIAACLYSQDGDHGAPPGKIRWVGPLLDKQVENARDAGCPQDASEFLDAYARVLK
jgi:hypothetical protein